MTSTRTLQGAWSVRAGSGPAPEPIASAVIPATVPGVVHLDLMAAGLIPDPYLDDNESALAWIGLVDWTYETTFTVDESELAAHSRHDLAFDGLDTVATVRLNGTTVAETANQHRTYRIDVRDALVAGDNVLTVSFRSPIRYANEQSVALGVRQRPYPLPYDAIRKSACSFGWDWGIKTATSGIWKPVRLESWSTARLASVRPQVRVTDAATGIVDVALVIERAGDEPVTATVSVAGVSVSAEIAAGETEATVSASVPDVELWWPAGYGEQPLYDVDVRIEASGVVLDEARRRVGFRTVAWDSTPDDAGTPFTLHVNGVPVFVKGANWIPDDAFPVRVDRARYERRLRQARAGHLNLIRVWGGGIYEADDFYDVADELGLLTWQDFLFACAAYAEEEPLRGEVEAEARDNVTRIGHHASLVLLTGNNENLWGYEDWGWKLRLDGKTWGAYYYYDLLPSVVSELAPLVPYAPGSPFSPGGRASANRGFGAEPHKAPGDQHPNAEQHGTMHIWDLWNQKDWPHYRDYTPRFVAEFGWQGPPTWSTLTRSISDQPLTPESPGMIVHQKAMEGNVKLTNGLITHYRLPEDMETWHWAMQLNQANAISTALEHFRSHAPHTAGAIIWQLNDCWPVTSWAAIDGDEHQKPLFYALRNAFAPRVVTIQPRGDGLVVAVVNDTGDAWSGDLRITRRDYSGVVLAEHISSVTTPARAVTTVAIPDAAAQAGDAGSELIVAELAGVRGLWFFGEPRDSALEPPRVSVEVAEHAAGVEITLTAHNLVRELTLLVDKIVPDAVAEEGLVTLLPGESTTILVRGLSAREAPAISHPSVLRSANQLVVT